MGRQNAARPPVEAIGHAPGMMELLKLVLDTLRVACRSRHALVLENLVLRQQLAVLLRTKRPRLKRRDKVLWVLVRWLTKEWRRHLLLVSPDTVVRWHHQGWRLFWPWKSRTRLGRPHLPAEVRELIATMSRENVLWGTERIRGELLKLGIEVSNRSIRRHRWRGPVRPASQAWRTFLANHAHAIWAAELFTVPTLTFRTLYVLFFIGHGRRELLHFRVTAHPTAAWVWQQLIDATPWGRAPRYLLRDRDRVYGNQFGTKLQRLGIEQLLTPVRAPRANAVAERMVGTFRRECLDHVVIVNEPHLHALLAEFTDYYNRQRPHRTLHLENPLPTARTPTGTIRSRPVIGGLHHRYDRVA
ncbi:MAG: integrase core domain-containing protein [Chloroflexota bacterium]